MNTKTLSIVVGVAALFAAAIGSTGASAAPGSTDLVLTKADSADPVVSGNSFTYTITVRNAGAINDASGVVVTDTLPAEIDFVSATSSLGACDQKAKTVTCNLGQVNTGVTATVTIVVTAKKDGTVSNTATVRSDFADTNDANNTDTETTVISKKGTGNAQGKASCAAPSISGTPGNDTLTGTAGADVIRGFAGDDRIIGLGGSDLICADFGNDVVLAGDGKDTVIGGVGRDGLFGGAGADLLKGKASRDRLRGQAGNDGLFGGKGRDSCKGGAGRDFIARSCRP